MSALAPLIRFSHLHWCDTDSTLCEERMICFVMSTHSGCSLRGTFWLTATWMQHYHHSAEAVRFSYLPAIAL